MLALVGLPAAVIDQRCRAPDNPAVLARMETADLGPFMATGLRPAIRSLLEIMADIRADLPRLYRRLGHAGMLCCRMVAGSQSVISNHAWGIAIDLTLDGRLIDHGEGAMRPELTALWPVFNRHGWFWGAAFARAEPAHFEASEQLVRQWAAEGVLGKALRPAPDSGLTLGDRSSDVSELQGALNRRLGLGLEMDGCFGRLTRLSVMEFQRRAMLPVDGIAGPAVLAALGIDLRTAVAA
ncbi:MAG: peptidoglycan-binding protein [Gemmobacter sp.]